MWWSQWGTVFSGPHLQAAQWYHVAVISETGSVNLYLNGSPVASGAAPFYTPTNTSFYLGAIPPWSFVQERLQGALDEVSVYNRALSVDEVMAIYQAGSAGKTKPEPRQQLHITASGNIVLLWWPASAQGFVLESSIGFGVGRSWTDWNGPVLTIGDQNLVAANAETARRFFRLRKQ